MPQAEFWPQLGAAMAAEHDPGEPRDALLFLHGDMKSLFEAGRAPDGRTGVEQVGGGAQRYWQLS